MKAPQIPTLSEYEEINNKYEEELKILNEEQRVAVIKSILSKNYHMVLGTPGSGKTTAIVVLIRILVAMKQKVLLVNFTN